MQYGSWAASYPLKLPRDSKVSIFPPNILNMSSLYPISTLETQISTLSMGTSKSNSEENNGCEHTGET